MSKITFVNPICSYCKSKMTLRMATVKRKVPPGSKDLGLSDEMMCWKCLKCEQTSREGISVCQCGKEILEQGLPELSTIKDVPIWLIGSHNWDMGVGVYNKGAGCTSCVKCEICEQPLASYDFERNQREHNALNGESRRTYYSYSHSKCVERQRRQWQEENRQREEREREKQYRIREGLCVTCGIALSFLDKLASRQTHKQCGHRLPGY